MQSLFVDRLTVIDFSYLDAVRGLVGESWILDVELEGELNDQGMLFDFSLVKKSIKQWIDSYIDHKLVVPAGRHGSHQQSQQLEMISEDSFNFTLNSGETIFHRSPIEAVLFIDDVDVVDERNIEQHLTNHLIKILPTNIASVRLKLTPEPLKGAYYHYSHGLQKHDGNCQRIAHGHRSSLEIEVAGKRDFVQEQHWASLWKDIYIATKSHQTSSDKAGYLRFEYQANQGDFVLELPERCCYLIEPETTVEQIAQYLAQTISAQTQQPCRVKAFEGVGKGAISKA